MSDVKLLKQIIAASEKAEFDKVVKAYLKVVYDYQRVVVTDGKDDTGIDIKVFDIDKTKNVQYQVTIQKSGTAAERSAFESKLRSDIEKAKQNAEEYRWAPKLFFFYSYGLTNKAKREYEDDAMKMGIQLLIVDGSQIAGEAEDLPELQKVILGTSDIFNNYHLDKPLYKDTPEALMYDLVCFGAIASIKQQLVESFILQCLFEHDVLSINEISELCIQKFGTKTEGSFYTKEVNKLYSQEHVLTYSKELKKYSLTTEKKNEIQNVTNQMEVDEQLFLGSIGKVLDQYQIADRLEDVIGLLKEIYVNNFSSHVCLAESVDSIDIGQLKSFLWAIFHDDDKSAQIMLALFSVCDRNKYLQNICASIVFSEKSNVDRLEQYAREQKKVFVDTTVVLYLLCHHFMPNAHIEDNFYYTQSKLLIEYCRSKGIKLYITNRYFGEVAQHVEESLRILPFSQLANFRSLGTSRNVFYRHFLSLLNSGDFDGSFKDYLTELEFIQPVSSRNEYVKLRLNEIGIGYDEIEKIYKYDNTLNLIKTDLMENGKSKTDMALKNDAIMLEFLGDNDINIHTVSPLFVTWDKTLFRVQNKFYKSHPNGQRWIQLTPSQLVDRFALLSFSVKQENITKEMLAILSGSFVQDTDSLVDTLLLILNPNNGHGLEYARRFAEMRDSKVFNVNNTSDAPQEEHGQNVIDDVVYKITMHYRDGKLFNGFKGLFLSDEHMDELMKIFEDSAIYYKVHKKLDENTYEQLDKLILKN